MSKFDQLSPFEPSHFAWLIEKSQASEAEASRQCQFAAKAANDIFGDATIFLSAPDDGAEWEISLHLEDYTDIRTDTGSGAVTFPWFGSPTLEQLLETTYPGADSDENMASLAALLRKHADRLDPAK